MSIKTPTPLTPLLSDSGGYCVTDWDLSHLKLRLEDITNWRKHSSLLGMTVATYEGFCADLRQALRDEELIDFDIRIQGSSARFFSGPHKTFPHSEPEWIVEFRKNFGDLPTASEVGAVRLAYNEWICFDQKPNMRPFDSMYVLGLNRDRSDYDVQISSDEIFSRAQSYCDGTAINLSPIDNRYGFVNKVVLERICPNLQEWMEDATDRLDRTVSVAAFAAAGPPNVTGKLSSSFTNEDWVILP